MKRNKSVEMNERKKNETYAAARAEAQKLADADGFDRRLEWNAVFSQWMISMLPARGARFGFEARCEVVSCSDLAKCQRGHGPCGEKLWPYTGA